MNNNSFSPGVTPGSTQPVDVLASLSNPVGGQYFIDLSSLPDEVPIGYLERMSPSYIFYAPHWRIIQDFRQGAPSIIARINLYCPRRIGEPEEVYRARQSRFSYTPVMSTAIQQFISKVLESPTYINIPNEQQRGFWDEFRRSTNGVAYGYRQKDEMQLINGIIGSLLYYGAVYVGVDNRTSPSLQPRSLGEAEQAGLLAPPYAVVFEPLNVLMNTDEYVITRQFLEKSKPLGGTYLTVRYTIWEENRTTAYEANCLCRESPEVPGIEQVAMVQVGGQYLPLADSYASAKKVSQYDHNLGRPAIAYLQLDPEQCVGLQVYLKQLEHMYTSNALADAGYLSGVVQRIFTPPPATPQDDFRQVYTQPDYAEQLKNTGNPYILIGAGFQYVESEGKAIHNLISLLNLLEEQIRNLVSMAFASGQVRAQSGVAKDLDLTLFEDTLRAAGTKVRRVYQQVLDIVAGLAGKDPVTVHGFEQYSSNNLDEMLAQAGLISQIPGMPQTAMKIFVGKIASLMTGLAASDVQEAVTEELEKALESGVWDKTVKEPPESQDVGAEHIMNTFGLSSKEAKYVLDGE
jgi:hypothetical protein